MYFIINENNCLLSANQWADWQEILNTRDNLEPLIDLYMYVFGLWKTLENPKKSTTHQNLEQQSVNEYKWVYEWFERCVREVITFYWFRPN